jgi:hypothetical protein
VLKQTDAGAQWLGTQLLILGINGLILVTKSQQKKSSRHHKKMLLVSGPTLITLLRGVYTEGCGSAVVEHSAADPSYQGFDISHKEFVKKPSRYH